MKTLRLIVTIAAICIGLALAREASAATYFVDPVGGLDTNPGTSFSFPVKTISKAGLLAGPGDTVNLIATGHYPFASFDATNWSGTAGNVITVQSYTGQTAVFDPGYPEFKPASNTAWTPCTDAGHHADEYVSTGTYSILTGQGTFLASGYRLMHYQRLEDLRATQESFIKVPISDPRAGAPIWGDTGNKYLWTYRGPGLWWNSSTQKIHFRASATHINQPGITDYTGQTDPRLLSLSVASEKSADVTASYITFKNIVFQNGRDVTLSVTGNNCTFDHCTFTGGKNTVIAGQTTTVKFLKFLHCVFDGRLPSYTARTDVKDEWDIDAGTGSPVHVSGCTPTHRSLLGTSIAAEDLEIANCEFRNTHDCMTLHGIRPRVHHNLFENINDDVFFLDGSNNVVDMRIYNNVIRKALMVFSHSNGTGVSLGSRYYYRNIIDLRLPVLGYRQLSPDPLSLWRYGQDFKMNAPVNEFYCYQNTFVKGSDLDASECSAFSGSADLAYLKTRRFMNNLHMTVGINKPLYVIPDPSFPAIANGNIWHRRITNATTDMFPYVAYSGNPAGSIKDLPALLAPHAIWTAFFNANGVGWETNSQTVYPQFTNVPDYFYSNGMNQTYSTADYRLKSTSPARGVGVNLTAVTWGGQTPPDTVAADTTPDIGALPYAAGVMTVGVDNRFSFPDSVTPIAEAGDYSVIADTDQSGFETVSFTSTGSSDPDGSISSYNWVHNGGSISTGSTFSKDLPLGTHQVFLTVTDNSAKTATDMREVTITDPTLFDNIVLNSGFENGSTSWTLTRAGPVVSSPTHYGNGALQLVGQALTAYAIQEVPVVAGCSVKVSCWIKTDNIGATPETKLSLFFLDASHVQIGAGNYLGRLHGTNPWAYYTMTKTAPSNAVYAQIRVGLDGSSTGSYAYYDDIRLQIIDNKVKNGQFERGSDNWTIIKKGGITNSPTLVHDGTGAMMATGDATFYNDWTQDIVVTAGTPYTISGKLKTNAIPASKFAKIQYAWYNGSGVKIGSTATLCSVTGTQAYTTYSATPTAPAGAVSLKLILWLDVDGTGSKAYFDAIYVK